MTVEKNSGLCIYANWYNQLFLYSIKDKIKGFQGFAL